MSGGSAITNTAGEEDKVINSEEIFEDYKEFKNLILQTSKIVAE